MRGQGGGYTQPWTKVYCTILGASIEAKRRHHERPRRRSHAVVHKVYCTSLRASLVLGHMV
jgi:hypothetical protein